MTGSADRLMAALQDLEHVGWTVFRTTDDFADRFTGEEDPMIAVSKGAIEDGGDLSAPVSLAYTGPWVTVQAKLAARRIWVDVPEKDSAEITVDPAKVDEEVSLIRILAALEQLTADGYLVEPCLGSTPSDGWAQLDDETPVVFWTRDEHEQAFLGTGLLRDQLTILWRGDKTKIAEALRSARVLVEEPPDERSAFVVR